TYNPTQFRADAAARAGNQDSPGIHEGRDRVEVQIDGFAVQKVFDGHVAKDGQIDLALKNAVDAWNHLRGNLALLAQVNDASKALALGITNRDQRLAGAMGASDGCYVGHGSQNARPVDDHALFLWIVVQKANGLNAKLRIGDDLFDCFRA